MEVFIRVKPGAKKNKIEKVDERSFSVWVKEPPVKGRANKAIVKLLADYFKIPVSRFRIKLGLKSKQKIIEIID
jgi:uncharacterized protein (TIGR00251 family)